MSLLTSRCTLANSGMTRDPRLVGRTRSESYQTPAMKQSAPTSPASNFRPSSGDHAFPSSHYGNLGTPKSPGESKTPRRSGSSAHPTDRNKQRVTQFRHLSESTTAISILGAQRETIKEAMKTCETDIGRARITDPVAESHEQQMDKYKASSARLDDKVKRHVEQREKSINFLAAEMSLSADEDRFQQVNEGMQRMHEEMQMMKEEMRQTQELKSSMGQICLVKSEHDQVKAILKKHTDTVLADKIQAVENAKQFELLSQEVRILKNDLYIIGQSQRDLKDGLMQANKTSSKIECTISEQSEAIQSFRIGLAEVKQEMKDHYTGICELRAEVVGDNAENKGLLDIISELEDRVIEHDLKVQKISESLPTATTSVDSVKIASNEIFKQFKIDVTQTRDDANANADVMGQAVNELKEDLEYLCTSQQTLREDIESLESLQTQADKQMDSERTHTTEYEAVSGVIEQIKLQQSIAGNETESLRRAIEDGRKFITHAIEESKAHCNEGFANFTESINKKLTDLHSHINSTNNVNVRSPVMQVNTASPISPMIRSPPTFQVKQIQDQLHALGQSVMQVTQKADSCQNFYYSLQQKYDNLSTEHLAHVIIQMLHKKYPNTWQLQGEIEEVKNIIRLEVQRFTALRTDVSTLSIALDRSIEQRVNSLAEISAKLDKSVEERNNSIAELSVKFDGSVEDRITIMTTIKNEIKSEIMSSVSNHVDREMKKNLDDFDEYANRLNQETQENQQSIEKLGEDIVTINRVVAERERIFKSEFDILDKKLDDASASITSRIAEIETTALGALEAVFDGVVDVKGHLGMKFEDDEADIDKAAISTCSSNGEIQTLNDSAPLNGESQEPQLILQAPPPEFELKKTLLVKRKAEGSETKALEQTDASVDKSNHKRRRRVISDDDDSDVPLHSRQRKK